MAGERVRVAGRELTLTNLDKVMYPATGTTKADVIHYYATVAAVMLPYARRRAATRKRWVHGVGTDENPGEVFFQKNLEDSAPSWVHRAPIEHRSGVTVYPLVDDVPTLIWLAQSAALEVHVPQWAFDDALKPRNPDRMVLDLDPGPGAGLAECAEVARLVRPILTGMGLKPHPVTSGSKGIHLYAALDGNWSSDQVSQVAHELARALEADHGDLVVSDMKKSLRPGKVLVDWSQNNGSKTTIAPYSLRGRAAPTAAAPRSWEELDDPDLAHLDYREVIERIETMGDLLGALRADVGGAMSDAAEALQATEGSDDRLATYRSMRDAAKTPEPIPAAVGESGGNSFVIQEHHARRLHYDFRLEHDGVLVSWAIPKGPPLIDTDGNRLAVHTEDHPLEYGGFEGTIPAGEYGGGTVTIWDAGTFTTEKWRDGEVIATLHGRPDGGLRGEPRRYALIRTGRDGKNWLIHLMRPAGGRAAPRASKGQASDLPRTSKPRMSKPRTVVLPMLAATGRITDLTDDIHYASEMKWDGYRAIVTIAGGEATLSSRRGNDLTATFADLTDPLDECTSGADAVLDGEVVALNPSGRPDFGLLQTRAGLTRPRDVEAALRQTPVDIMLFDILELNGRDLRALPYDERRRILTDTVTETERVHVPDAFDGDPAEALTTAERLGLEGIVAKRRDSRYAAGSRSSDWVKIKFERTQEVIVIGWRAGNGSLANAVGSLLVAVPGDEDLRYAGRVGSGLGESERRRLIDLFETLEADSPPVAGVPAAERHGVHWLEPRLVGEVAFSEWTSGGTMRHPRWRGWRTDKSPEDVRLE